jgi:hypothetical protein
MRATLPTFSRLGYKNLRLAILYIKIVRIPAKVNLTPAKSIVEGTCFGGIISAEPIFINGVALPHNAQHKSAANVTNIIFENSFEPVFLSVIFLYPLLHTKTMITYNF